MPNRVVYFNGDFVPELEARVSIFDSALMFGDMVFEMTRTFRHRPFRLRAHLERLYASMRLLQIDGGMSIDDMERATLDVLERNLPTEDDDVDWLIMHDVSNGPLRTYHTVFPSGARPTVSINCWPLIVHMGNSAANYRNGVRLEIPSQQAIPAHLMDAKAKTRSRQHYAMANTQAARMDGWPVLMDTDGFLAEGTGFNIFLVKDGVLYTPEPRNILLGVSRGTTMELAHRLSIPVREANLGRYEAMNADELFCTATTYSLVHASHFEGQPIGTGGPGPVFSRLTEAWKKLVGLDLVAQAQAYESRMAKWEKSEVQETTVNT
ncbi:MAG: branched-chain amino acid aminotransferase [Planctomycetes bacterium]|nr:branched-chain amino acid aminotransferase [Planctomycetota bacterium]